LITLPDDIESPALAITVAQQAVKLDSLFPIIDPRLAITKGIKVILPHGPQDIRLQPFQPGLARQPQAAFIVGFIYRRVGNIQV
jgi:hypothetical protein